MEKKIILFNTMTRKEEEFVPLSSVVGMYCCGPTVYNYAHIGNLRTFIFEDVLKRTLIHAGYKVKHVMNITDVGHLTGDDDYGEDKMEKTARETGKSVWEIADFYTKAFFEDFDSLNLIRPDVCCKATDHIAEMIQLIKRLESRGFTYRAGGNVYFSIDKFKDYGTLARLRLEELKSGVRINIDENKKNPKDFALWFTNSKFANQTMIWDSPWGKGYPGWHIECSAMSMHYLGEQFDIHCGGIDAIPVHHTNEIAQSEAATGKVPWVRYWLHGEFLLSEKGKMSKSTGDFLTLPFLVKNGFDPLDYRFFCYSAHYRTQLSFSIQSITSARTARLSLIKRISELGKKENNNLSDAAREFAEEFDRYVFSDMSVPRAMGVLYSLLKSNQVADDQKYSVVSYMDEVLGLKLCSTSCEADQVPDFIRELLEKRNSLKKEKNWAEADLIRKEIESSGYSVKDTPQGSVVEKK